MELWKDIPNYEGLYQASTEGEIKSYYTGKILKQEISKNGYCKVMLCKNRKRKLYSVHRLIAVTYLNNYNENLQVNHINGIKTDNKIKNLEMVTCKENIKHSFKNKLQIAKKGKEHPLYKKYGILNKTSKKINQYDMNGKFIKTWNSIMDVERQLHISNSNISRCCNKYKNSAGGYKWKYTRLESEVN